MRSSPFISAKNSCARRGARGAREAASCMAGAVCRLRPATRLFAGNLAVGAVAARKPLLALGRHALHLLQPLLAHSLQVILCQRVKPVQLVVDAVFNGLGRAHQPLLQQLDHARVGVHRARSARARERPNLGGPAPPALTRSPTHALPLRSRVSRSGEPPGRAAVAGGARVAAPACVRVRRAAMSDAGTPRSGAGPSLYDELDRKPKSAPHARLRCVPVPPLTPAVERSREPSRSCGFAGGRRGAGRRGGGPAAARLARPAERRRGEACAAEGVRAARPIRSIGWRCRGGPRQVRAPV